MKINSYYSFKNIFLCFSLILFSFLKINAAELTTQESLVLDAVKNGELETVEKYIKNGGNIDVMSWKEQSMLIIAADHSKYTIVGLLLKNGASINGADMQGNNLLHFLSKTVATKESIAVMQNVIDQGAKINHQNQDQRTPLHFAVEHKNIDAVKLLIKAGANINVKDHHYNEPIYTACCDDKAIEIHKYLLSKGADINGTDISQSSIKQIEYLLDKGLNLSKVGQLHHRDPEILAFLKKQHAMAAFETSTQAEQAYEAIENGQLNQLKSIIEKGFDLEKFPEYKFPSGRISPYQKDKLTLLDVAIKANHYTIIKYLLSVGAKPQKSLNIAIKMGQFDHVKLLINEGAEINPMINYDVRSFSSNTLSPLIQAIEAGNPSIINFLIEKGANLNPLLKGSEFEYSKSFKAFALAKKLPIVAAAWSGNLELVKDLITKGVPLKYKIEEEVISFNKLLVMAYEKKYFKMAGFLKKQGLAIPASIYSEATNIRQQRDNLAKSIKNNDLPAFKNMIEKGYEFKVLDKSSNIKKALEIAVAADFTELVAHINHISSQGLQLTDLMTASIKGDMKSLKKALKKNDVNAIDSLGNTAFKYAIQNKHEKIALRLLKAGADSKLNIQSSLFNRKRTHDYSMVFWSDKLTFKLLNSNIEFSEDELNLGLSKAISMQNLKLAKKFILMGAQLREKKGFKYYGLLLKPVMDNDEVMINFLVKNGADVNNNTVSAYGQLTPLSYAVSNNPVLAKKLLIAYLKQDKDSDHFILAVMAAVQHEGQSELLKLILNSSRSINLDQVLQEAVKRSNVNAVKLLIEAGASKQGKTMKGITFEKYLKDDIERLSPHTSHFKTVERKKKILDLLKN